MTASKSLPPRPSLDSLRKQAKKLARERSLSQRNAQLVLARDYGFAGWQDLTAEVSKRLGNGLEWGATQAQRVIHDNDVERLKQLLAEYPALLSWQGDEDGAGLLGMATGAYGDAGDPQREQWFTRAACAELLIDAGAVVAPSVCEGILQSRASGLLELFRRKGLLPRTLFDVADFLLAHGADINTRWSSHEPASILHHLVFEDNYESMQYLIDRGIDMTIKDYRWNANAIGWARYGKSDEKMAQWLEEAERQRKHST